MSKRGESSKRQGGQRRRGEIWSSRGPSPHGPPHVNPDAQSHTSAQPASDPSGESTFQPQVYSSFDEVPQWARGRLIHPAPQLSPATLGLRHPITNLSMPSTQTRPLSHPRDPPPSTPSRSPKLVYARPPSPAEKPAQWGGVETDYIRCTTPRLPPSGSEARGAQGPDGRNFGASRALPSEAYPICRAHGGGEVTDTLDETVCVGEPQQVRAKEEGDDWYVALSVNGQLMEGSSS